MTASAAAGCGSARPTLWTWLASAASVAAAILLWGVGAEAVYFGHRLSGGFLLADAAIVTMLEAATAASRALSGGGCVFRGSCFCRQLERLAMTLDTYKRAIVYALLTAPCFVQLHRYWLPALPGGALVLSSILYAVKHCCTRKVPYDFGKMPTFVRFEEDCYLTPEVLPPATATQNIYQPSWPISVELSDPPAMSRDSAGDPQQPAPPPPPRRHRPPTKSRVAAATAEDKLGLISDDGISVS